MARGCPWAFFRLEENMKSIDKVLTIAHQEIGYLEKRSNSQLDSKTANAGSSNYTKYARDLYPSLQGQPWCDMFVDWCMVQAFGQVTARQLLGGGFRPIRLRPPSIISPEASTIRTTLSRETRYFLKTPSASAIQVSSMRSL